MSARAVPADRAPRHRAVVLVGGPAAPYSRSLRIARALAAEGLDVEIAAIGSPGLPAAEPVAGPRPGTAGAPEPDPTAIGAIVLRRYRPSGIWAWLGRSEATGPGAPTADGPGSAPSGSAGLPRRVVRAVARPVLDARRWLAWPHAVRGWWATLARDLEPADLYHACGSLTIAAALAARDRTPIGPGGGRAVVVYDAIDDVAESNEVEAMPRPIRRRIARTEAAWARAADALITVNPDLAERLGTRWGIAPPPLVVGNLPEPPDPARSDPGRDRLREAAGLPSGTRIVLFQGRLGPNLGLDVAAEAVLTVPDAALVLLGFGRGLAESRRRDREPRFAGRHVTLPAVEPDELLAWTASADVALIPLPPVSANQRLSTPNKLWEALAVGTPVVLGPGLKAMERLVREHDLGTVAASTASGDLAAAIAAALDRVAAEGPAWRAAIAATARERFAWPPVATAYRSLARSLLGAPPNDGGSASQST